MHLFNNKRHNNFFITGLIRTGTTALAEILNTATNADVTIEKGWILQRYTPSLYKTPWSVNMDAVYKEMIEPLAKKSNKEGRIYGDKHEAYIPWITYLKEPVVLTIRNGYDTVRSMMNWHDELGWIYPEADYPGHEIAPIKDENLSDVGRIRPRICDRWCAYWKNFDRFDCCCWYWSRMTDWALDLFGQSKHCMIVNVDNFEELDIIRIFYSLGLKGYDSEIVNKMINQRINSVETRFKKKPKFPRYGEWSVEHVKRFEEIAGETQKRFKELSWRLDSVKEDSREEMEKWVTQYG